MINPGTVPPVMPLDIEAAYWNEEYYRCFGVFPNPMIGIGVENSHVNAIQSAVMRHWVESLKALSIKMGGGYLP